jgi:hypothetical protein
MAKSFEPPREIKQIGSGEKKSADATWYKIKCQITTMEARGFRII